MPEALNLPLSLHIKCLGLLLIAFASLSCSKTEHSFIPNYGTEVDSARYYFLKGWEEILDNGRWTESEVAFRKASALDPDWLLGKSMIGRITRNLEERQRLFAELDSLKDNAGEDERMLLDVNLLSMQSANNRGLGIPNSPEANRRRVELAERNFGKFSRKYPSDNYFKAEYIEFLHAIHGARVALDSLNILASAEQQQLGFYLAYAADLELELGNTDRAMALSLVLDEKLSDPSYLSPLMLKANIYISFDSLEKASELVDRVVAADSNHMIAKGLQSRIREAIANEATDND
ncbi:hypothetical protein BFP97_02240 [Roseivirga sp. 4D4]|uniref:hypothetical protein n=1 Tax=Roseivirga sp. 4D4 TaxID=1889784 RepID=UPI000853129D|nr:hypothetical protein [Roseivirga sp. 4D4]OEK00403.1 hypothetical protein BFP97_02240 [Roseivirga sp. 4D4]